MAYSAGDTILDDEYNAFVANSSSPFGYNHFAGTGATVYGLGQTAIDTVSAGGVINASQWNALFTGITNIANHTNDTITSRSSVSAGDDIDIASAVAADLATLAASVAAGSPNATALATSSALQTQTSGSEGWNATATQEVSVTFASANNMRFFFNGGGKVRITVGIVAAATSDKDTAYANLGTALGNLDIASLATTRSGSGETLTTNNLARGFQDMTTSYQNIIKLTSDNSGYTGNNIEIFAKTTGGSGASGAATVLTIKMVATDGAADDQYTAGNTDSVAAAAKDTPKMVTTLFTLTPTTAQGLGTAYGISASAAVSNAVAD
jgi:hypothetical protein|tara:strand:+ start:280 stop:1251 length:972 start_codon:yes stop_codon:yes gene_type:complete